MGVVLGIAIIGMLAVYGYRMYLYFPDRAPYTYMENNVAARWMPGYREWIMNLLVRK